MKSNYSEKDDRTTFYITLMVSLIILCLGGVVLNFIARSLNESLL